MFADLCKVVLVSLGSILALFLMTKLMGNKQMSELSMFDYIVGITIGSIAAEMATALESDWAKPLTALVVYGVVATFISLLSSHSIRARRFIGGRAIVLFEKGRLYRKNFARARLDVNEFLMQCRVNGYFDLSEIELAMLEPNGHISILPKAAHKPLTPQDMKIVPGQSCAPVCVIVDGKILPENLKASGKDARWLESQARLLGAKRIGEIFLATVDDSNRLTVYLKNELAPKNDLFQ